MKNRSVKIIIFLVVVVLLGGYLYVKSSKSSIAGCYVARLAKDVYVLDIKSGIASHVTGTLSYNNAEKDSTTGTFSGTYSNNTLLADYTFNSEGIVSVRQVIFKKIGGNFIEGFGDVTTSGNTAKFSNMNSIAYDPNSTFVPSASCQ